MKNTCLLIFLLFTPFLFLSCGDSGVGGSIDPTTTTGSAPSAPTGVSASPGNGQVTITWTSVSDAASYNIYSSTESGVTKTIGTTKLTSDASPYKHTGLTNGTTYYYVVTAVNSFGESSESIQVSETPLTPDTTAPSSPS